MTNVNYEAMDDEDTFVPIHMRGAYQRWIEHGLEPGGFGIALITANFEAATHRADAVNAKHIMSTFQWFVLYAPVDSFGSEEQAYSWKGTKRHE